MANIIDSLFGPTPYDVGQQRNQQDMSYAEKVARMGGFEQAKFGIGQGAAGMTRAGAGMMGMVDPLQQEASMREQVMGMGGDLTTSAGLKAKAAQFAQAGDQRTAMKLAIAAKAAEAREQAMIVEAQKQALAERKQNFNETEAFELKKQTQAEKMQLERDKLAATNAQKLSEENFKRWMVTMQQQGRLDAVRLAGEMKQSGGESKPMTEFQRTNFKQKITKSQSELRGIEGAYLDLEAKANELIAHPGLAAATGVMGMAPSIPGGDAAKADALIQEFKSAIKKQGLEMAREGGSIGQMTEREWPIVESMVANIDPVKLGLEGTKAQIAKAVAYAKNLVKRAQAEHSDLVSAMPEELQKTVPKGKVNFGDLK